MVAAKDKQKTESPKAAEPEAVDQPTAELVTKPTDREVTQAVANLGVGTLDPVALEQALTLQTQQRALIKKFIQDHLDNGTDFGRIHVVNRDKCPNQYTCTNDYHYSKAVLFKPGQEKLFSLFQINDTLERDAETYEMLPDVKGLVAYKCTMYRGNQKIGEGRGSATVGDNRRDANATIKIAEKRARMDACLSLGFSEYFAQDLDDPDYKAAADQANKQAAVRAEAMDSDDLGLIKREPTEPLNNEERTKLFSMIRGVGYKTNEAMLDLLVANGVAEPQSMTSGQARDLMRKLRDGKYESVAVKATPPADHVADDNEDIAANLDAATTGMTTREPVVVPTAAELVVDDELRSSLHERIVSFGLNSRGEMWIKKYASGKPYGNYDDWSDTAWRKLFDVIEGIDDGRIEVDKSYITGVEQ